MARSSFTLERVLGGVLIAALGGSGGYGWLERGDAVTSRDSCADAMVRQAEGFHEHVAELNAGVRECHAELLACLNDNPNVSFRRITREEADAILAGE